MTPVAWLFVVLSLVGLVPPAPSSGLPPASPSLTRVAEGFLRFARDAIGSPPSDTPVELLLGHRPVATISGAEVLDPASWRVCTSFGGYAGRVCPFSAVEVLADHPGTVVTTSAKPRHSCLHADPPPRRLAAYRSVVLTGAEEMSCMDYFAVQLFVNDVGQVIAVDLVLTEP